MNKKIGRRFAVENITISISLICVLLFVVSCGPQLINTRILAAKPVPGGSSSSYPDIRKMYKSDDEIVLVSNWNPVSKSEGHKIRWEIYNSIGEMVHTTGDYDITIRPHMFNSYRIRFDQKIKNRLSSGMCKTKMYLDENLVASHDIEYVKRSIINHNIDGAVILPFRFAVFSHKLSKGLLNTVPNAIYGEVKRIVKNAVPPAVAEERIGDLYYSRNVNDKDLMTSIAEGFSEDIFVTGSLDLGKYDGEPSRLTVCVYHSRTQAMKRFTHSTVHGRYYAAILADLIQGVLYEEDFLDYLRAL